MRHCLIGIFVLIGITCAGCSGGTTPPGAMWTLVVQSMPDERQVRGNSLARRVKTYISQKLPLSYQAFREYLGSERFNCGLDYRVAGDNREVMECVYFETGPVDPMPCQAGEDVAIAIRYSYSTDRPDHDDLLRSFDVRTISRMNRDAHTPGICAPF